MPRKKKKVRRRGKKEKKLGRKKKIQKTSQIRREITKREGKKLKKFPQPRLKKIPVSAVFVFRQNEIRVTKQAELWRRVLERLKKRGYKFKPLGKRLKRSLVPKKPRIRIMKVRKDLMKGRKIYGIEFKIRGRGDRSSPGREILLTRKALFTDKSDRLNPTSVIKATNNVTRFVERFIRLYEKRVGIINIGVNFIGKEGITKVRNKID